jgi:hypothetical protein
VSSSTSGIAVVDRELITSSVFCEHSGGDKNVY